MFNQSSKTIYAKYGKYTVLQTCFSEKNIWFSIQMFPGIAAPKLQGNMIAIFDFLLSNRIPISRCFTKYLRKPLYESHVCNRCFFKEMSFYGHELFRTVSDSCFRVTFISSSENHKRIIIFLLYLPFPLSFLYSFEQ